MDAALPSRARLGERIAPDPAPFVRHADDGTAALDLFVAGMHCGNCVQRIERGLAKQPGIVSARANLTTRRLAVRWRDGITDGTAVIGDLAALGYDAMPFADAPAPELEADSRRLIRALAVAGFAAANVMLLSVALWAGGASDMDTSTRDLFHWISALIVLPAAAYALGPFAANAWRALRAGQMGMDLPITVAVAAACSMSLFETLRGGPHVYFEAAIMLLFFLLIGRVLDRRARARAGQAAENLMVLRGATATRLMDDGTARSIAVAELRPGMTILVAAGERVPADGVVHDGASEVDVGLLTGESLPEAVAAGGRVLAGTINRAAPLTVAVTAAGDATVLAEVARLVVAASQDRSRYVRLADRAARIYAPAVHVAALAAFALWWGVIGAPWQEALMVAVAVLIVTCPCALGLAVPVVQVVACGRLLKQGIIVKSGDALERLAAVDHVEFDKTGTLTGDRLALANGADIGADDLAFAAAMAMASRHPLCRAIVAAAPCVPARPGVQEVPGQGLVAAGEAGEARLGSRAFCGIGTHDGAGDDTEGPELWLSRPGSAPVCFAFRDAPRADAAEVIAALEGDGLGVGLLSGDRDGVVKAFARALGIADWRGGCLPADKLRRLRELAAQGRKVLMVGDGINDAPALAAAHVSMSPAAAADITQASADIVFIGETLAPVRAAWGVARAARRLVRENFALAFAYNLLAVPVAMAGLVTPLIAAAAMSASSLIVTFNALRLARGRVQP